MHHFASYSVNGLAKSFAVSELQCNAPVGRVIHKIGFLVGPVWKARMLRKTEPYYQIL